MPSLQTALPPELANNAIRVSFLNLFPHFVYFVYMHLFEASSLSMIVVIVSILNLFS